MHKGPDSRNAIVLAMFGTSVEHALAGLLNIRDKMAERFPATPVGLAFTSTIIRRIWQQRAQDPDYLRLHREIPEEILHVRGPLAAIANMQDAGYGSIVVQAVHIAPAEEYEDLCSCVRGLRSIKRIQPGRDPFRDLVVGRPALGSFDSRHPYAGDLETAAASLAADIIQARQEKAALVYLGHGNRYLPAKNIFNEFAAAMNRQYPDIPTVMTTLDETASVDEAIARLGELKVTKVLLKPFLVAAGGHVVRDMVGGHPQSLKSRLEKAGLLVHPELRGLGEQDDFARIYVRHAADAAQDAGIDLR